MTYNYIYMIYNHIYMTYNYIDDNDTDELTNSLKF